MAVPNSEAVQWLPSGSTSAESRSGRIGPISLEAKQTGERSAGNPHAAFDEAGAGNVARPRWCDTRRRKSEPTGNTNFGLNRRASPENRGIAEGVELDRTHGLLLSASRAGRAPSEKRVNLARTQLVASFVPFDGRIRALPSEVALEGQGLIRRTDRIATSGRDEDACFGRAAFSPP